MQNPMERSTAGDLCLLKIPGRRLGQDELRQIDATLRNEHAHRFTMDVLCGTSSEETYLYLNGLEPDHPSLLRIAGEYPGATLVVLDPLLVLQGKSAGHAAPFHYIVETDVTAEAEQDMNLWYEREHLPGLAAVPGNVLARRYVAQNGSPRYYACYDLVDPAVRQTSDWVAVTETDWSSRVRPQFRNTKRTIFQRITLPSFGR